MNSIRLASNQLRVLPLRISHNTALSSDVDAIPIELAFTSKDQETNFVVNIPIRHRAFPGKGIIATYFYAESMPTAFAVNSPTGPSEAGEERAAVVALRMLLSFCTAGEALILFFFFSDGAGVDAINMKMWHDALPQRRHSWTILPTGRTEWVSTTPWRLSTALRTHILYRVSIGMVPRLKKLGRPSMASGQF